MIRALFVIVITILSVFAFAQEDIKIYDTINDLEAAVLKNVSDGMQEKAEKIIKLNNEKYQNYQKYNFMNATLLRSRFMINDAMTEYSKVILAYPYNNEGFVSFFIRQIDYGKEKEQYWKELNKLYEKNKDNIWFLWLVGIEARNLKKNDEGIVIYKELLGKMNIGSSLMHQTYGNLLAEKGQYDDALVERKKTVELDEKSWAYDGLANTLTHLKRDDEAEIAYKKAIELDSENVNTMINYTILLCKLKRYIEAENQIKKAIELDEKWSKTWYNYGVVLEGLGKHDEAIEMFKKAKELDPPINITVKEKDGDSKL